MRNLRNPEWWKAAFFRAVRTVLVIAAPYAATVLYVQGQWLVVVSSVAFAFVLSFIFSILSALPETTEEATPWGWAVAERVIKTALQALITVFGTATMFQDVNWAQAPQLIGTAVLGSLVLAFMKGVPEAPLPVAAATVPTISEVAPGSGGGESTQQVTEAPVVAPVSGVTAAGSSLSDNQGSDNV